MHTVTITISIREIERALEEKTTIEFVKQIHKVAKQKEAILDVEIRKLFKKQQIKWSELKDLAASNDGCITKEYVKKQKRRDLLALMQEGKEGIQREVANIVGFFRIDGENWVLNPERIEVYGND